MDLSLIIGVISIIVAFISLYYSRKQTIATVNQASATDKSISITQESQITERFTRAVDQLGAVDKDGNPAMEIRLGAISSLEMIANKSDEYYWPIMEYLTAYLRKNSPVELAESQNKVSLDIQAILTVIGRRKHSFSAGEIDIIDLQKTYLREAFLPNTHFEVAYFLMADLMRANLSGANLKGTYLVDANLETALLFRVNLEDAHLERSNLKYAFLNDANLEKADLKKANLVRSHLGNANLEGANLEEAKLTAVGLKMANLRRANLKATDMWMAELEEADFQEANFEKANLEEAYLKGANLQGAKNLKPEQLSKAFTLYKAQLDPELEEELRERYSNLFDEPKDKI